MTEATTVFEYGDVTRKWARDLVRPLEQKTEISLLATMEVPIACLESEIGDP